MVVSFVRLLLVLALLLTVVHGFQQPLQNLEPKAACRQWRHAPSLLFSSASAENNNNNAADSLSNIVNGMLQTQQEIARETKELYQSLQQSQDDDRSLPQLGKDGIYNIMNQEQLLNFKSINSDKMIILKFSSPVCQACRVLKQQFPSLRKNETKFTFFNDAIVVADITISNNKNMRDPFRDYVTSELNIHKIPTIHLYKSNNQLVKTITCDPQKGCSWSAIKKQIIEFVNEYGPALVQQQQQQQQQENEDDNSILFTHQDVNSEQTSSTWIKRSLSRFQSIRIRIQRFIFH
jgi:thiol-disulfide isomerase/thioredoxin